MKKLPFLLTILLLSACIDVEDFGTYWNQASIDPTLAGTWKQVPLTSSQTNAPEDANVNEEVRIVMKGDAYEISGYQNGLPDGDPSYPIKSFKVGGYQFFVLGPQNGSMVRYSLNGNVISTYILNADAAIAFIRKNYPHAKNIDEDTSTEDDRYIKITSFNEDVFKALSAIPDNEGYWQVNGKYERKI